MRHLNAGRKFGRSTSHRRAMFRNLAANLVLHERVITTEAKAKELRRIAERMVSKAARLGDLLTAPMERLSAGERAQLVHARRIVARDLRPYGERTTGTGADAVERVDLIRKLFIEIAPRFVARAKKLKLDGPGGGYTRIVKLGNRRGDNAPMTVIEFLPEDEGTAAAKKKS